MTEFQGIPDKRGNQRDGDHEKGKETLDSVGERFAPAGVRLLEEPDPNYQRDRIAREESDPMDSDPT